jgi:hypothetical protein
MGIKERGGGTEIKRELIFVIIHSTSKGAFSINFFFFVFKQNSTTDTH